MGAEPYQYVVEYESDVEKVLQRLREEVFLRGEYNGADLGAKTPEEALELSGADGTRSILDIARINQEPDYCCAAPLTDEELQRYFGTEKPTVAMVESCEELWDDLERGMARYVVTYEDGGGKRIVFVGYSFD